MVIIATSSNELALTVSTSESLPSVVSHMVIKVRLGGKSPSTQATLIAIYPLVPVYVSLATECRPELLPAEVACMAGRSTRILMILVP